MTDHDVIIVGAGAAGSVLASRLSENPRVRVLLLESGSVRRNPLLAVPAGEVLWMGDPRYDWGFETQADPTIDDRRVLIPRGRLLGGSNAINGMLFVRGQAEDYDGWAAQGNPGWSWEDVLPAFRRIEHVDGVDGPTRGHDGPIAVGPPRQHDRLTDAFVAAGVAAGWARNPDYNSGTQEGVGYYQATQEAGRRSSVTGTYLRAARRRPNLFVQTDAHVTGLTFNGRRCTGVEYRANDRRVRAGATREVILSAGTVQSPQILEVSGIGAADVLIRAGVPIRHLLPGVGEGYRDHYAARLRWRVRQRITFNDRTRGWRLASEIVRYLATRRGVLSLPTAVGYGFVRSSPRLDRPDIQLHFAPASYGAGDSRRFDTQPGMTLGVYPLRPESCGAIHIRSGDPLEAPAIHPRFLDDERDVACLVAGMRLGRALVEGPALDPYRGVELTPGDDVRGDGELAAYARAAGDTSYHPIGTCRMGPDPHAVVDHRLRVHGLAGLRVIDASVMPTLVSGNTNAAALMIGERGAELVAEDLRQPIRPVTVGGGAGGEVGS